MRLSTNALAITLGLVWGGCIFVVGIINLAAPSYGAEFLRVMGSVYPGFFHVHTFWNALLGTLYGLVDGLIGGWILGGLYNCFTAEARQPATRIDKAA